VLVSEQGRTVRLQLQTLTLHKNFSIEASRKSTLLGGNLNIPDRSGGRRGVRVTPPIIKSRAGGSAANWELVEYI